VDRASETGAWTKTAYDRLLGHIDAVTVDDAQMLAFELLRGPTALAVIGPYDDERALVASVA